jgi:rhomboid protease GluP
VNDSKLRAWLGVFPFTSGLVALLVAMFLIEGFEGGSEDTATLLRLGANYPPLTLDGQAFRLLASTLLHIGVLHLVMNGWALLQLGRLAEMSFGGPAMLALFVLTGIGGSSLTLLTTKVSAGASGAIFGILGALLSFFLRHRERLSPSGRMLLKQLTIWAGFVLAYSFLVPGIDLLGHLGGFAAGLAVGWALKPWRGRTGAFGRTAAALSVLLLAATLVAVVQAGRPAERRAAEVALAAPIHWLTAADERSLGVYLPNGASVRAVRAQGGEEEALVSSALEGEEVTKGQLRQEGPFVRRTFVQQRQDGEWAGFAQARCEGESCVLVVARAPAQVWSRMAPELETIADSARPILR